MNYISPWEKTPRHRKASSQSSPSARSRMLTPLGVSQVVPVERVYQRLSLSMGSSGEIHGRNTTLQSTYVKGGELEPVMFFGRESGATLFNPNDSLYTPHHHKPCVASLKRHLPSNSLVASREQLLLGKNKTGMPPASLRSSLDVEAPEAGKQLTQLALTKQGYIRSSLEKLNDKQPKWYSRTLVRHRPLVVAALPSTKHKRAERAKLF
jgi:hypothetical protein